MLPHLCPLCLGIATEASIDATDCWPSICLFATIILHGEIEMDGVSAFSIVDISYS